MDTANLAIHQGNFSAAFSVFLTDRATSHGPPPLHFLEYKTGPAHDCGRRRFRNLSARRRSSSLSSTAR